ncbi:hypothetical protein ACFYOT_25560 [Saccharothrix saharensis]|uniref:hypothetical protein n=1 Tax=Saccharothrix saharensis TaxID=571190 RepID=UPI0036BE0D78
MLLLVLDGSWSSPSLVALALNVADSVFTGQFGKAAFDAVGPVRLIGWAKVGPGPCCGQ